MCTLGKKSRSKGVGVKKEPIKPVSGVNATATPSEEEAERRRIMAMMKDLSPLERIRVTLST